MSLVEEQRVTTVPDIGTDLMFEVDTAIPCQIDTVTNREENCTNKADFLVLFKTMCDHHSNLYPGDPMVCGAHAAWLTGDSVCCGACGCNIKASGGWTHYIIKFVEI